MPHEGNHTCNLIYLNASQLMQIRHPVELFYAAHILDTNDLPSLLIEINSRLFKSKIVQIMFFFVITNIFLSAKLFTNELSVSDKKGWQSAEDNFRQARLNYYKRKKKLCQSRREGKLYNENPIDHIICTQTGSQSTSTRSSISMDIIANERDHSKKDEINSFIVDDDDDLKRFDDIRKVCDQFTWNALENNSTMFLLSRYLMSNKLICSVSDIDSNISYQHMCQYGE